LKAGLSSRKERIEFQRNLKGLQTGFLAFSLESRSVETAYARLAVSKMTSVTDLGIQTPDEKILTDIQAALESHPDSIILDYLILGDKINLFACTADTVSVFEIDGTLEQISDILNELYEEINLFVASREYRDARFTIEVKIPSQYSDLGKLLLGPVADLLQDKQHIYVVPTGILHSVPFNALSIDDNKYLIENFTLSVLPSSFSLVGSSEKPDADTSRLLILRGDEGGLNSVSKEIKAIEKSWNGKSQTVSAVEIFTTDGVEGLIKEMDSAGMVHFTGHAEFDPVDPYSSVLRLSSDVEVEVNQLMTADSGFKNLLHLTLAACETGVGKAGEGDDVVGLGQSFLALGVNSVLMSLWKVSDDATAIMMPEFYQAVSQGTGIQTAHRLAVLKLVSKTRLHPYFFAPFQLTGHQISP